MIPLCNSITRKMQCHLSGLMFIVSILEIILVELFNRTYTALHFIIFTGVVNDGSIVGLNKFYAQFQLLNKYHYYICMVNNYLEIIVLLKWIYGKLTCIIILEDWRQFDSIFGVNKKVKGTIIHLPFVAQQASSYGFSHLTIIRKRL